MDDSKKTEIMNRLKGRGIKYYQIVLKKNSYKFGIEEFKDINPNKITYLKELNTLPNESVKFQIIKSKILNFAGIGEIDVLLKKKINRNQLSQLADYLRNNILSEGKTIFINYYLTPPNIHTQTYASTNFEDGKFKIEINSSD